MMTLEEKLELLPELLALTDTSGHPETLELTPEPNGGEMKEDFANGSG